MTHEDVVREIASFGGLTLTVSRRILPDTEDRMQRREAGDRDVREFITITANPEHPAQGRGLVIELGKASDEAEAWLIAFEYCATHEGIRLLGEATTFEDEIKECPQ